MKEHVWNSETEVGELIASLIKIHSAKNVLEIGVFEGKTGVYMMKNNTKYTGIDITDEYFSDAFLLKKPKTIIGNSLDVLPTLEENSFDLIFIDSLHEYDHLKKEFKLCEKLIRTNGLIVLHDSLSHIGVTKWVNEIKKYNWFEIITLNTPKYEGKEVSGLTIIKCLFTK